MKDRNNNEEHLDKKLEGTEQSQSTSNLPKDIWHKGAIPQIVLSSTRYNTESSRLLLEELNRRCQGQAPKQ